MIKPRRKLLDTKKSTRPQEVDAKKVIVGSSSGSSDSSVDSSSAALPCREKEVEQIKDTLLSCIQGSTPKTIYIAGETGTGKTACVKQVLNELETLEECSDAFATIFINAMKLTQPFKAFEILYENVIQNTNSRLKARPKKSQYKSRIENYFKNAKTVAKRKYVIVVIDEMDFFVMNTSNNTKNIHLLYDLVDITRDSNSKLCIIGISNTVSLLDKLHAKIKSRFDDTITFYPYENDQIRTIIENKILCSYEEYFEKGAIKMIGSIIARKTGDIRRAIDIIKRCIEVHSCTDGVAVDSNGAKKPIDSSFVKTIVADFTEVYPITQLSIHHKILLYCTIQEYEMKLKSVKENSTTTESNPNNLLFERVVMRFQNLLAMAENTSPSKETLFHPSMGQLEHVTRTLVELGILSIEYDNKERLPVLHFQMEYQQLLYALEQDPEMKGIMLK